MFSKYPLYRFLARQKKSIADLQSSAHIYCVECYEQEKHYLKHVMILFTKILYVHTSVWGSLYSYLRGIL